MSAVSSNAMRRSLSWIDSEAMQRARLFVVPRGRTQAKRLPFIVMVSALLVVGVVGLLVFNTQMQQASFTQSQLSQQATELSAREQALETAIQKLQDPQSIAVRAQAHGMVLPETPAILMVPSGKVKGTPTPAGHANTPQLWGYSYHPAVQAQAR